MKNYTFLTFFIILGSVCGMNAQSIADLKSQKAEKEAQLAKEQAEADALKSEVKTLNDEILKLSGWQTAYSGLIGFDFKRSNNWVSSPNTDARSSSLNLSANAFANKTTGKYFWKNKLLMTKSWQDVDLTIADQKVRGDGLFDNGTVDILNLSSLYGRKLTKKIALSGLAELNTSVEGFLSPGTFDFGLGATWSPSSNLTIVIHPLNYHMAFSGIDNVDTQGSLGSKLRADYSYSFSNGIAWNSTLTTFIPYQSNESALFEYTWLNTLSYNIWKNLGIGVSFGIRNAEFESPDIQSFYSVGMSYSF